MSLHVLKGIQPVLVCWLAACSPALYGQASVLTWHNDNARTGRNLQETILTTAGVNVSTFGKRFVLTVDGKVDAQPLYMPALAIPAKGTHNVLYVVTEHDSVYAFDADDGTLLRQTSLLEANETPSDDRGCDEVTPEIGVTATPVIDPESGPHGTIYVVATSKDASSKYLHRLHALDLTTLVEEFNGPVEIAATYSGSGSGDDGSGAVLTFDPSQSRETPGLLLVDGVVYTSWSSPCDFFPYTGWVIGYNKTTLEEVSVLSLTPNGRNGGIWAAGPGAAADASGNLYSLVGNGTFESTLTANVFPVEKDYANAFVRMSTNGGALNASNADQDLGLGGSILAAGASKDANAHVVDHLGKFDAGTNRIFQRLRLNGQVFSSPAWFNGKLYYAASGDALKAFAFESGAFQSNPASQSSQTFPYPGATPSISANGTTNGIVWVAENSSPAVLHAYDASNLADELYNSNQASNERDHFGDGNKLVVPTVVNGKVYVGTNDGVGVFGLLASSMSANGGTTPQSARLGTAFGIPLSLTVQDAGGNPVAGVVVTFTAPSSGVSGTFANGFQTTETLADNNGVASVGFFTANTVGGGPYSVVASATGLTSVNFALTNTAGPPSTMTANSGTTPQSAKVGTVFGIPLSVTVQDAGGNPAPGVVVTFTAPLSGASGTFANGITTTQATTDSNGVATTTTFTANTVAGGPYNVVASATALPNVNFALTNTAGSTSTMTANSGTTPQSARLGTAFGIPLSVTVQDAGGNPVAGVVVTFTAPSSGASGTFANGFQTTQTLADNNGVASAGFFTANTVGSGPYNVVASATGLNSVNFALTNTAGPPPTMTANSGTTPQSAKVGTAFGTLLSVTVQDAGHNPVLGVVVTFTAPASGASGTFTNGTTTTQATTDSNGVATTTTFTANTVAGGPYNVVASATALPNVNFALTNTVGTHSVTLTWSDLLNPTGTTYNVYRANGLCTGTPPFAKIASTVTAETYTDTTVTPGNYCYEVTATANGMESAPSNTAAAPVPSFASSGLSVTVQ